MIIGRRHTPHPNEWTPSTIHHPPRATSAAAYVSLCLSLSRMRRISLASKLTRVRQASWKKKMNAPSGSVESHNSLWLSLSLVLACVQLAVCVCHSFGRSPHTVWLNFAIQSRGEREEKLSRSLFEHRQCKVPSIVLCLCPVSLASLCLYAKFITNYLIYWRMPLAGEELIKWGDKKELKAVFCDEWCWWVWPGRKKERGRKVQY